MQPSLEPLTLDHLEPAAELASRRCRALRQQVETLPAAIERPDRWRPLLKRLIEAGSGVVALRGGQPAGFLGSWQLENFQGMPTVYSPEWANGAADPDPQRTYQAMYRYLAARWREQGYHSHIISLLAHAPAEIATWSWLGFGHFSVDALRSLTPLAVKPAAEIRQAGLNDVDQIFRLSQRLCQHMASSPIFLETDIRDEAYFASWLDRPDRAIWLAYQDGRPVAYLQQGPANDDVSQVTFDAGTSSIYGAYTLPQARGQDVGTALVERARRWAKAQGYQRLAVDFESMNHWASRFWLRHFRPVVISLQRRL